MQKELLDYLDAKGPTLGLYNDRMLSERAGITASVISKARSGYQPIGFEACLKLADALNTPKSLILMLAGHLDENELKLAPEVAEFAHLFQQLDDAGKEEVMMIIRLKVDKLKKLGGTPG